MRRRTRRVNSFMHEEDTDPLSIIVNLFDVAMVFAVALMVAVVIHINMTEVFSNEDFTVVKNPGTEDMEIIRKENGKITKYTSSKESNDESQNNKLKRKVGIAYELENGEIIYIPEETN